MALEVREGADAQGRVRVFFSSGLLLLALLPLLLGLEGAALADGSRGGGELAQILLFCGVFCALLDGVRVPLRV